jgi:hypothetical protein
MDLRRRDASKLAAIALLAALGLKWLDMDGVWSTKPLERAEVWGAVPSETGFGYAKDVWFRVRSWAVLAEQHIKQRSSPNKA